MQFPNGEQVIDTLEYDMADAHGQFLGEGITEIKESKLFYKEGIRFPVSGNYSLEVFQAMRKNGEIEGVAKLSGNSDVGFRIEKNK
jgi:gliding motility-associated lipoprotein GldH